MVELVEAETTTENNFVPPEIRALAAAPSSRDGFAHPQRFRPFTTAVEDLDASTRFFGLLGFL